MNSKIWVGRFYGILAGTTLVAGAVSYYLLAPRAAVFCVLGSALLGGGFKLTEILVGVLTKTRSANVSGIAVIFAFKLGWWGIVIWVAIRVQRLDSMALLAGFGAFLVAILLQALWAAGAPKLSAHNKDS